MDTDDGEGQGVRDEAWVEAEVRRRQRLAQEAYARSHGFVIIGGVPYIRLGEVSEIEPAPARRGL